MARAKRHHISFGGTLGYYKIDMEQVQTVAWGQAETANTVYFKNGQSLQFTNYDAYNVSRVRPDHFSDIMNKSPEKQADSTCILLFSGQKTQL